MQLYNVLFLKLSTKQGKREPKKNATLFLHISLSYIINVGTSISRKGNQN
jgi:hypothetical protein